MNNAQKILAISAVSLACATTHVTGATFDTEASATIASMYLWRGFDVSQEDPALQGDFIVNHESGFWIGAWATTYDIGIDDGVEVDFIGGYNHVINDSVSIGAGFTEYTFTGDSSSTTEFYVTASVENFSLTYNEDVDLDATYISLDAEFELVEKVSLLLHAGDYSLDNGGSNNEYHVGLSYAATEQLALTALYSDNDLNVPGAEDYFVAFLTYSF